MDNSKTSQKGEQGKVLDCPFVEQGNARDDEGVEDHSHVEDVVPVDEEGLRGDHQEASDHLQHEVDAQDELGHFQPIVGVVAQGKVDDHDDEVDEEEEEGEQTEENALDDPPVKKSVT